MRVEGFASLARGMSEADDERARMQLAADAAVQLVDRCKHAGVTLNRGGECLTLAASDDVVRAVNVLQNEMGEGPCHDPHRSEEVLVSNDVTRDPRWERWGTQINRQLGASSLLSVMIFSGEQSYGTVSLYAPEVHAFGSDDLAVAQALAAHLAVALSASREIAGLGIALHSRTVIGQAVGIVMERLGIDADQSLGYLKRVSSHRNTRLAQVAADLVQSRELPEG